MDLGLTKDQLKQLIDHKVPRLNHENEHQWRRGQLFGCETCGHHDAFECVNCNRVVDSELDLDLYGAIDLVIGDQQ